MYLKKSTKITTNKQIEEEEEKEEKRINSILEQFNKYAMQFISWKKVKYCDESHMESQGIYFKN
jgi:hypothetical protein